MNHSSTGGVSGAGGDSDTDTDTDMGDNIEQGADNAASSGTGTSDVSEEELGEAGELEGETGNSRTRGRVRVRVRGGEGKRRRIETVDSFSSRNSSANLVAAEADGSLVKVEDTTGNNILAAATGGGGSGSGTAGASTVSVSFETSMKEE